MIAQSVSPFTEAFLEALTVEVGTLQAKHPRLADAISRGNAVLLEGHVHPLDDGWHAEVGSSDDTTGYLVTVHADETSSCTCPAGMQKATMPCKHRIAFRLYQLVVQALTTPTDEDTATATIPPQFVQMIKGKPFVRYVGLVAMAHEQGLVRLEAEFISVTETLALAWAQATFKDGRVFKDAGDATPTNVGKEIAPHFARMSLTRAKARCLRDSLNIGICSVEELA